MYHLLSGLYSQLTQKRRCNVLVLGIEGSGKTAWLDRVRAAVTKTQAKALSRFVPTVGQNFLDLDIGTAVLHIWDLGGDASLRRIWARYYNDADVFVWVMDARDWRETAGLDPRSSAGDDDDDDDDEGGEGEGRLSAGDLSQGQKRRRDDAWQTLESMSHHGHLATVPLLLLMTHMDCFSDTEGTTFRARIQGVFQERMQALAIGAFDNKPHDEADELTREELKRIDNSESGARHTNGVHVKPWQDWTVLATSAKTKHGLDDFVNWLKQRGVKQVQK